MLVGRPYSVPKLTHVAEGPGTLWQAEPIVDDPHTALPPLELFSVTFGTRYYTTAQGRKKVKLLESEFQQLVKVRHTNLLDVLAVRADMPHANQQPRLLILCERRPSVTLQDVLEDCDSLREDRASVRPRCAYI